jgi:hypothetical protein
MEGHTVDATHPKTLSVPQQDHRVSCARPTVAPILSAFARQIDCDGRVDGEFLRAADKVGMDVRFSHGRDAQLVILGESTISINIAFGIDKESFPGTRTADQIRILREGRVFNLLKKHAKEGFLSLAAMPMKPRGLPGRALI